MDLLWSSFRRRRGWVNKISTPKPHKGVGKIHLFITGCDMKIFLLKEPCSVLLTTAWCRGNRTFSVMTLIIKYVQIFICLYKMNILHTHITTLHCILKVAGENRSDPSAAQTDTGGAMVGLSIWSQTRNRSCNIFV